MNRIPIGQIIVLSVLAKSFACYGLYGATAFSAATAPASVVVDAGVDKVLSSTLLEMIATLSTASQKAEAETLHANISRQYAESGEEIKKLLASKGRDTTHFEKNIVKDFDFFSISNVNKVVLYKNVAFVETFITYQPEFVTNRHRALGARKTGDSIWNSMGGTMFAQNWEEAGTGIGTFYLVRQNDLWKVHCIYFSAKPLSDGELTKARKFMETLAGPNAL